MVTSSGANISQRNYFHRKLCLYGYDNHDVGKFSPSLVLTCYYSWFRSTYTID